MHKKKNQIQDLPDCYYKSQLLSLVQSGESMIWVVAKEGYANDWAAYCGWPTLSDLKPEFQSSDNYAYYCARVHEAQDVCDRGDKWDRQTAVVLFPELQHKVYRG